MFPSTLTGPSVQGWAHLRGGEQRQSCFPVVPLPPLFQIPPSCPLLYFMTDWTKQPCYLIILQRTHPCVQETHPSHSSHLTPSSRMGGMRKSPRVSPCHLCGHDRPTALPASLSCYTDQVPLDLLNVEAQRPLWPDCLPCQPLFCLMSHLQFPPKAMLLPPGPPVCSTLSSLPQPCPLSPTCSSLSGFLCKAFLEPTLLLTDVL